MHIPAPKKPESHDICYGVQRDGKNRSKSHSVPCQNLFSCTGTSRSTLGKKILPDRSSLPERCLKSSPFHPYFEYSGSRFHDILPAAQKSSTSFVSHGTLTVSGSIQYYGCIDTLPLLHSKAQNLRSSRSCLLHPGGIYTVHHPG